LKYYKSEDDQHSTDLYTKEYIIKEDHIDFNNEFIKFDSVELSKGIIKIHILLNQRIIESNIKLVPNYFIVKLNQMKFIKNYLDVAWSYINDIKLRFKFKVSIAENQNNNANNKLISKDRNAKDGSTGIKDRVKLLNKRPNAKKYILGTEPNENKDTPKKLIIYPNLLDKEGNFRIITSQDKINKKILSDKKNFTFNNNKEKEKEMQKYLFGKEGEEAIKKKT
jgi:hypothetical protein